MHVLCLWLRGFSYGAEVIWTGSCKWPQYGLNAARTYPETSLFTYVAVFRRLRTFIDRPAWCNLEVSPVTLACFFCFLTLLELPKRPRARFGLQLPSRLSVAFPDCILTLCSLPTWHYRPSAPLSPDMHGDHPRARQTHSPALPPCSCVMP